jgi:hypothetical protein
MIELSRVILTLNHTRIAGHFELLILQFHVSDYQQPKIFCEQICEHQYNLITGSYLPVDPFFVTFLVTWLKIHI